MRTVADARAAARARCDRGLRQWAAYGGADAEFSLPLGPPTERIALSDLSAAIAWAHAWQGIDGVEWGTRSWPSAGTQRIPERLILRGADAIASFAGAPAVRAWRTARQRADALRGLAVTSRALPAAPLDRVSASLPDTVSASGPVSAARPDRVSASPSDTVSAAQPDRVSDTLTDTPSALSSASLSGTPSAVPSAAPSSALSAAIRTHTRALLALDGADFERLLRVLEWLIAHPASGWRIRQLPIRGVDTKWLGRHRGLVEAFHRSMTGRAELGLVAAPALVRVRILDPALQPSGLADLTLPIEEWAELELRPARILIVENLETALAMPETPGTVVVHGAGFGAGDRLGRIPWILRAPVVYWGDLDSNGFAILNQLRSRVPDACSVLMDADTLYRHRDLWVPEPKPATGELDRLTRGEQAALAALRVESNVRLEQERIEWSYALGELARALGTPMRAPDALTL